MQIMMTATEQITHLDRVQCRVWEGVTAGGVPCKLFIHRIAVAKDQDSAEFERELAEQLPPGVRVPLVHVL